MTKFNVEEEISNFQGLSVDPLKSRMEKKSPKRNHVSPESLILSILNVLFQNPQNPKTIVYAGHCEPTNSDACSLKFAKVGSFTSRSNEFVVKDNDFNTRWDKKQKHM